FVMVPSETETPIWGMTTSVTVVAIVLLVRGEVAQTCDDVVDLRDERLLEWRREGHWTIRRGDAADGRVEVLERLLGDRRRDLGAEASGARVLVQDEDLRRLPRARQHRVPVPRDDRAEVDDLDGDAVLLEPVRRLLG